MKFTSAHEQLSMHSHCSFGTWEVLCISITNSALVIPALLQRHCIPAKLLGTAPTNLWKIWVRWSTSALRLAVAVPFGGQRRELARETSRVQVLCMYMYACMYVCLMYVCLVSLIYSSFLTTELGLVLYPSLVAVKCVLLCHVTAHRPVGAKHSWRNCLC